MSNPDKKNYHYINGSDKQIAIPETLKGIVINIQAAPTNSKNGWGVGGVGETYLTRAFENILGQETHIDAGHFTRTLLAKKQGQKEPLEDKVMLKELEGYLDRKDPTIDIEVDNHSLNSALSIAREKRIAVVGTKILQLVLMSQYSYLLENSKSFLLNYLLFTILVTAPDEVATSRKLAAGKRKNPKLTIGEVDNTRRMRMRNDVAKYKIAYPEIEYSFDELYKGSNILFDNTLERTPEEMKVIAREILSEIGRNYPLLAPYVGDLAVA